MWSHATDAPPSLRRRLLVAVLALIAAASLVQGISAYQGALEAADAMFDQHLQELAASLQEGTGADGPSDFSVQIWGPGGVQIFRGLRLPAQPEIGFSDVEVDGVRYRVYQLRTRGRVIQVAQDLDARQERARALGLRAVLPLALMTPLLLALLWLVIDRSLRPVERARRELAGRRPGDTRPVGEAGLPQEVLPLVRELNSLFERAGRAYASQQRFIADAAHELRSPLTALKLQAQAAQRQPDGPARAQALQRLDESIDRGIALATQLLALARAEADEQRPPTASVDLEAVCRDAVSDVLPLAESRRIDLGMAQAEALHVRGDADALRMLLRNLLDNAIKYTPEGGRVDLSLQGDAGAALLVVEDSGPGIPADQRERVFDRFHRVAGSEAQPGAGLGLSIVAAIVRQHGAGIALGPSAALGGLRVEVRLTLA